MQVGGSTRKAILEGNCRRMKFCEVEEGGGGSVKGEEGQIPTGEEDGGGERKIRKKKKEKGIFYLFLFFKGGLKKA